MEDMGLKILEQKVIVMQNEVSQVLNEMQSTIQAIAKTYSIALKVMLERIDKLEKGAVTQTTPLRETDNGKEL